jgi:large subunit ribosomal protein L15
MTHYEVQPYKGARKSKIRRGRGDSSGYGSFSGRGCKGQNSRSGGKVKAGFGGGQTPLWKSLPKKKGFTNINRIEYQPINLVKINDLYSENETVSELTLYEKNIISSTKKPIKILGNGELTKSLIFENVMFSKPARDKVIASGSKIIEPESLISEKKE